MLGHAATTPDAVVLRCAPHHATRLVNSVQVNAPVTVKLNNLAAFEVNTIRLSFLGTLNMYAKLEEAENAATPAAVQQQR